MFIFPDTEAGADLADLADLPDPEVSLVRHESGRPWLMGRWNDDELCVAEAGNVRLAVYGCASVTPARFIEHARRITHVTHVDRLATTLPGSFHLIAVVDGCLRIQGSASGLRRVYYARVDGTVVAADRADVLAVLRGPAVLDVEALAVRLIEPLPCPLRERSVWHSVQAVSPGEYLAVDKTGLGCRTVRWWNPPAPEAPIAEGGPTLAKALMEAVGTRVDMGGPVGCDLSGGLDSTTICFLAARGTVPVHAYTALSRDPDDDDIWWARQAAAALPTVTHVELPTSALPFVFADLTGSADLLDEPSAALVSRAKLVALTASSADRAQHHLTGYGGDQVLSGSLAHYHDRLRRHPVSTWRRLNGFGALIGWRRRDVLKGLADRRSYQRWLTDIARLDREDGPGTPPLGWGFRPVPLPWLTPAARDSIRAALRAASASPLATGRGPHVDLEVVREGAQMVRAMTQMLRPYGVRLSAPMFDDHVVEACLGVRPEDRISPWAYKPLLTTAMRGLVPYTLLSRTTKAEGSIDVALGMRAHGTELSALWDDSRLAALGLVDPDVLRSLCARPDAVELQGGALFNTVACELWLRSNETRPAHRAALSPNTSIDRRRETS